MVFQCPRCGAKSITISTKHLNNGIERQHRCTVCTTKRGLQYAFTTVQIPKDIVKNMHRDIQDFASNNYRVLTARKPGRPRRHHEES